MNTTVTMYGALLGAIIFEVIATSFLTASQQFSRLVPTVVSLGCYACSFYMLSIALRFIPVGIAYAIWSGLGIVLISIIGTVVFKQHLDLAAYIGLGLIIAGVLVVHIFSKSITH